MALLNLSTINYKTTDQLIQIVKQSIRNQRVVAHNSRTFEVGAHIGCLANVGLVQACT